MGLKSGRQHQTRNMTRNFSHVSYIFRNPVNHLAFLHTPHKIQFFIAYVIFSFPKAFYGKLPTPTICQCFWDDGAKSALLNTLMCIHCLNCSIILHSIDKKIQFTNFNAFFHMIFSFLHFLDRV